MSATKTHGVHYAWTAAAVMGAVAVVAWLVKDQWLVFSAAIVGLYVLHMVSVRYIVRAHADQLAKLTGVDVTALEGEADTHAIETPVNEPEAETGNRNGKSAESDAAQPDTEAVVTEAPAPSIRDVAIPRHFMLGTVAIVRSVMAPEAVARVLMEQRLQPGKRFGELAVAMDLITQDQLEMLLEAQQRGLFTDEEIREARSRLEAFRRAQTEPAASV